MRPFFNSAVVVSEPNYPTNAYWKQITLSRVRIGWEEPSSNAEKFDYYVIDGERLMDSKSSGDFSTEIFSKEIPKGSCLLITSVVCCMWWQRRSWSFAVCCCLSLKNLTTRLQLNL